MYNPSHRRSLDVKHYSVRQAQELIKKEAWGFGFEIVNLADACDRVIAEDIYADRNYPPFNRSAVDGFAIRSQDLLEEDEFEIVEEVHAGFTATKALGFKTAIKVMTGAPVPAGADAVIKVEDTEVTNNHVTFALKNVRSFENISLEGEDTKAGDLVIPKNTWCTPAHMGTLAALGKAYVKVFKHPVVVILSTGNEIKEVGEKVLSYQIRDSNFYSLLGFFAQYGITPSYHEIVPDEKNKIKAAVEKAADADILILSGGVSMGDADFVPEVLYEAGVEKIFHKAEIKPGKPIWFGTRERSAVFALPGNPFSVQVAFKIFIESYLRCCMGLSDITPIRFPLKGMKKKKTKFDEYFPCKITDSKLEIISFNGSGDIKAALSSQGIALHPAGQGEIPEGEPVEFYFWNNF